MPEYTVGASNLAMFTTRERLGIDDARKAYLHWAVEEEISRQNKYIQYRNYYAGEHEVMLTDRQKDYLELDTDQDFSVNMCALVVDELERRMSVRGFDAPGKLGGQDGELWTWWRKARMDAAQADVHLSAIRDGDTYVIVSWDQETQRPEFSHNLAYDGSEGVRVHYSDETGKIVMASKRWTVETFENGNVKEYRRMNLYFPDRVERYASSEGFLGTGGWQKFDPDGQGWRVWWTDDRTKTGKPLGIPIFHLKYKPSGFRWGKSILEDVIGPQNALNKAFIDTLAAADTSAFRVYWATGTTLEDEDGNQTSLHPGAMLIADDPDAAFGYLQGESLRPLIEVVDMCKVTIAQVSETPMHLFQVSGQNASEGAQKQQEVGMINKAEKWGVLAGNFWEDCMQMAIRLSNTFAGSSFPTDEILDTQWHDMEVRDKTQRRKDMAETAETWVSAGATLEDGAREAGVPPKRASEMGAVAIPIGIMPGEMSGEEQNETS